VAVPEPRPGHDAVRGAEPLDITVRTSTGTGSTSLAAFDHALLNAGVANFNLIHLSSVIPHGSRVRLAQDRLPGGHGDRLFCVLSVAHSEHPGDTVFAGLGWTMDETGGLFVEHTAGSPESLDEQIRLSLGDMSRNRGHDYGEVHTAWASAHYVDQPVCALAVAAFEVLPWTRPGGDA
jgi:arginine decarboxylase